MAAAMSLDAAAELAQMRQRLALLRAEHRELLASARASVAAARDGLADPLAFVRLALADRGQLPPAGMSPAAALAHAGLALLARTAPGGSVSGR